MAYVTLSDPLLRFAVWAAAILLALSSAMLLGVVALRIRLVAHRIHQRHFMTRWEPLLAECALHEPAAIPRVSPRDGYSLLKLWNHYHESLSGDVEERLNDFARRTGLDRLARAMLRSGQLRRRLIGMATAGHLRDADAVPVLKKLLESASTLVSLSAARALLRIDPASALPLLIPMFISRTEWPLAKISTLLAEAGADRVTPFLAAAAEEAIRHPPAPQDTPRLLRLLARAHSEAVTPCLLRLIETTDDEETLAAGLGLLHTPLGAALARRCCAHPAWSVRVAAARALGKIGAPEDRSLLVDMLSDAQWWVRYSAARALVALPFVDPADLAKIRLALPDRFAQDMLAQVIAEQDRP